MTVRHSPVVVVVAPWQSCGHGTQGRCCWEPPYQILQEDRHVLQGLETKRRERGRGGGDGEKGRGVNGVVIRVQGCERGWW